MNSDLTVDDCLTEIRRLRAENDRLRRLVRTQRPELEPLRDLATMLGDYLNNGAQAIERAYEQAKALLPGHDDLPSTKEVAGILSDSHQRVLDVVRERSSPDQDAPTE